MPIAAHFGRAVEERFIDFAENVYTRILAKGLIAAETISAFHEFEARRRRACESKS